VAADTYAESFHRDFFGNWARGVPPERCSAGTEGHNTAQIGGFVVGCTAAVLPSQNCFAAVLLLR
jgi:hypothetical protein